MDCNAINIDVLNMLQHIKCLAWFIDDIGYIGDIEYDDSGYVVNKQYDDIDWQ